MSVLLHGMAMTVFFVVVVSYTKLVLKSIPPWVCSARGSVFLGFVCH